MSDILHGITLEAVLTTLVETYGWEELARRVPARCFQNDPSLGSSLKFLRQTPWARTHVERIYIRDVKQRRKKQARNKLRAARRSFAAAMPVERPETLAFFWPETKNAPAVEVDADVLSGIDRAAFMAVQQSIGFSVTDEIWTGLQLVPGGMCFAYVHEQPVAVACAEQLPDGWTELAWVTVDPAHRGKGLGRAVCVGLLNQLLSSGHRRIVCSTQDERIHALRIYLNLGFRPVQRPEKEERWAAVKELLR